MRRLFDTVVTDFVEAPVFARADLAPGARLSGPAVIVEDQTTTIVSSNFDLHVNGLGYLVLDRRNS